MLLRRSLTAAVVLGLAAASLAGPVWIAPASAQTADREARLGWVRERYEAEQARIETLTQSRSPDAYLELGELLVDGPLISPENPLRKPDLAAARRAFEEGLKVPSKVWPLAATRLASLLFAGGRGQLATPDEIARGMTLLKQTGELGYGHGAFDYGTALELGLGGPGRVKDAADVFRLSLRLQYPEAAVSLARIVGFDTAEGRALMAQGLVLFDLFGPRSRGLLVELGDIWRDGTGVKPDPAKAAENYRRAFSMGSGRGGLRLAEILLSGRLGAPDPAEAKRVLEETAWSGSSFASIQLTQDFFTGGLMQVDESEALAWLDLALAVEDYRAFALAAKMSFAGKGLPRDQAKGEEYARLAIANAEASVSDLMSIAKAARAALGEGAPRGMLRQIYSATAQRGSVEGMVEYGSLLLGDADDRGNDNGSGDALAWLEKAADAGSARAMILIGDAYRDGRHVEMSPETALAWYRKAIDTGKAPGALVRSADLMLMKPELGGVDEPLALLKQAAAAGNPSAESRLGRLYLVGGPVPREPAEARRWLEAAIGHGDAGALVLLVDFYQGRYGDTPDPAAAQRVLERAVSAATPKTASALATRLLAVGRAADAITVLERAAGAGNAEALVQLGVLFLGTTEGVPRDLARAERYFDQAAKLSGATPKAETDLAAALIASGEPLAVARGMLRLEELAGDGVGRAAALLSDAYRTGRGAPIDLAAAERWALEAAKLGNIDALVAIADASMANGGSRIAQEKAVEFYSKALAADPHSVRAMVALGRAYTLGRGTAQDLPKAIELYRQAADAGSGVALIALANAYAVGSGVEADPRAAVDYLERAVARGLVGAYVDLGRFYLSGFGGRIDAERAVYNFSRAAAAGNLGGLTEYGRSLISGFGISRNLDAGIALLERAANGGVVDAMTELYGVYGSGFYGPPDPAKAVYWLERAASTDDDALEQIIDLLQAGTITMAPSRAAYWQDEARRRAAVPKPRDDGLDGASSGTPPAHPPQAALATDPVTFAD